MYIAGAFERPALSPQLRGDAHVNAEDEVEEIHDATPCDNKSLVLKHHLHSISGFSLTL